MQENTEPITVECTTQPENYTIEDLEKILRVKRRQIFNYAKAICNLHHWESEAVFRPSQGRFSVRMLAEMRRLQSMGADEYRLAVGRENHRPVSVKIVSSAQAVVVSDSANLLDTKIANLQQNAIAQSESLADLLRAELAQIKNQNALAKQQSAILSDGELLAAQNRGYLQAVQLYRAEIQAKETALSQLRAMKLEEG